MLDSCRPRSASCSSLGVLLDAILSTAEQSRPCQLLLHLSYCSVPNILGSLEAQIPYESSDSNASL